VSGNSYRYECTQTLAWWLEPWTATLAGISLGLCALDCLTTGVTLKLRGLFKQLAYN